MRRKHPHRLLLLAPFFSGCALFTLAATERSHPELDGSADAPGLQAELRIDRDQHGIPYVRAQSEEDAWYGLGYAHAQDRLFQADMGRHLAHGRISEWLGEKAIEFDVFVASMELERLGQRALDAASPETRAMIRAYTAGLNAGAESLAALPVEYRLLKVDFEPWREVDTTGILFLQGWSLQENLDHELAALALHNLSSEDLDALFQTYPNTPPIDPYWETQRGRDVGELTRGFKAFTGALGGRPEANSQASNNWVIGGGRTASGKPIVANDPHLVQRVPSLWYAAGIAGGGLHVAGATLPGTPGFPVGHNERVAWGLTNVMADTVDIAVLERDGEAVIVRGEREVPERRRITLNPRKAAPVEREVLWTSLGPIINSGGEVALVLRWTGLEIEDHTHDQLRAMVTSTDITSLRGRVTALPSVAPQNLAMGDIEGGIGWTVTGSLPKRRDFTGRVPYPASSGALDWEGWITDFPGAMNPAEGYLATANNKPPHPSADAIATAYLPPHRHKRITEVLSGHTQATPEDMHALQLDLRDNAAALYLPRLLQGITSAGPGAPCLEILSGWDYESTADSPAPAVWAVFQEQLFRVVLGPRLSEEQLDLLLDLMTSGRHPLDGDFDHFLSDRPAMVGAALDRTCTALGERLGPQSTWSWGRMHALKLKHPFGDRSSLLGKWNMEPLPYAGSGATVAVAGYKWSRKEWNVNFMASLRVVMPLGDLNASTLVHPGGQSGQPKSPYYRSLYDTFVEGRTAPLWFNPSDVHEHSVHRLVLKP